MDIFIDEKAKDYIKRETQDNSIQVMLMKVGGGWCVAYQPSVKMGTPFNTSSFKVHEVDDINVFVPSNLRVRDNKLKISLSKFFWIKSLNVDGVIS